MRTGFLKSAVTRRLALGCLAFAAAMFAVPQAQAKAPCSPAGGQASLAHHARHGLPSPMSCCETLATLPVVVQTTCSAGSADPAAAGTPWLPLDAVFHPAVASAGFPGTALPWPSYYARSRRILR